MTADPQHLWGQSRSLFGVLHFIPFAMCGSVALSKDTLTGLTALVAVLHGTCLVLTKLPPSPTLRQLASALALVSWSLRTLVSTADPLHLTGILRLLFPMVLYLVFCLQGHYRCSKNGSCDSPC
jgi:hypothetical protein